MPNVNMKLDPIEHSPNMSRTPSRNGWPTYNRDVKNIISLNKSEERRKARYNAGAVVYDLIKDDNDIYE